MEHGRVRLPARLFMFSASLKWFLLEAFLAAASMFGLMVLIWFIIS
jgi:hypothetical protein